MGVEDIAVLPIPLHMPLHIKQLRKNAPFYIKEIIEKSHAIGGIHSIEDLSQNSIKALSGGMLSAVYFLKRTGQELVINLRSKGVDATAEAFSAWQKKGANIVNIISSGIVPTTRSQADKVKYLIMEGIVDKTGKPAQTAQDYVRKYPEKAKQVGIALGRQLAKMHQAKTERSFGEYADMWGNTAAIRTWNNYLTGYISFHQTYLTKIGINEDKLKKLIEVIKKTKFSKKGRYIHGDFSMRNAIVESEHPLKLKIIDPNPLVGHYSWDLAVLYNNKEFSKRKFAAFPKNKQFQKKFNIDQDCLEGFIEAYQKYSSYKIDRKKVLMSQVMQIIFLTQTEEKKLKKNPDDVNQKLEYRIRKELLVESIETLLSKYS